MGSGSPRGPNLNGVGMGKKISPWRWRGGDSKLNGAGVGIKNYPGADLMGT